MAKLFQWRRKRDDGNSLAKYLYLSDKSLVYQLITAPGSEPIDQQLPIIYGQLEPLKKDLNKSAYAYFGFFAATFLARFGLVSGASGAGFSLSPNALSYVLILGFATSQFIYSLCLTKFYYVRNIFEVYFQASSPSRRATILARYPLAYDILKYYPTQIGTLPHTASMRLPKRMLGMLLLLVPGLIVYVCLGFWVFLTTAFSVWESASTLPSFWTKAIVIVSISIGLASFLLPSDLLIKRSYMHIGLIKMMNRAHSLDRPRYTRYHAIITRLKERANSK